MELQAIAVAVLVGLLVLAALAVGERWAVRRTAARRLAGEENPVGEARDQPPLGPESFCVVQVSDTGVSCRQPDGLLDTMAWDDLQRVEILTTAAGPLAPDVFWVLHGSATGCVVPQGATGEQQLLERLQRLPGFRNEAVIRAMSSAQHQRFLCWERQKEGQPPGTPDTE